MKEGPEIIAALGAADCMSKRANVQVTKRQEEFEGRCMQNFCA